MLTVPVNALLALAEGGYGVRVVDGTPAGRIVAVSAGLFARGQVEVTGDGLDVGTEVEVPASSPPPATLSPPSGPRRRWSSCGA